MDNTQLSIFAVSKREQILQSFVETSEQAHRIHPSKHCACKIQVNSVDLLKTVKGQVSLTCDGFNRFTGDRLADEIILNEAGGLRRDLH